MFPETKQGAAYFQMSINRAFLSDESQITREIVASMANHSPLHNFHRSPCLYPHPCADAAQRVHMHALTRDHVFDANFAERKAVNRGQPLRREHVAFGCDLPPIYRNARDFHRFLSRVSPPTYVLRTFFDIYDFDKFRWISLVARDTFIEDRCNILWGFEFERNWGEMISFDKEGSHPLCIWIEIGRYFGNCPCCNK